MFNEGAILFSVMGGKLSEGINFSDHLARCVIVVGMPYPDKRDIVFQEKLKFADSLENKLNLLPNFMNKESLKASDRFYDAVCMKSVNQSIGRSIRHVNDFAAIILLDSRYLRPRIQCKY
jgi:chromosome transmission fidelity protein 1